jgi:hypothetical protein
LLDGPIEPVPGALRPFVLLVTARSYQTYPTSQWFDGPIEWWHANTFCVSIPRRQLQPHYRATIIEGWIYKLRFYS